MGFTDDSDNDLPDWLSDLGSDQGDQGVEFTDGSAFGSGEDKPEWASEDSPGSFDLPEEEQEGVPDWLSSIREQEGSAEEAAPESPSASEVDDNDEETWLKNIRTQNTDDEEIEESEEEEAVTDILDTIQALKDQDAQNLPPVSDDEPTIRLKDYFADKGEEPPEPEEKSEPDWISGLPAMDFENQAADVPDASDEDTVNTDWLKNIREQEAADRGAVEEELPPAEEQTPAEEDTFPKAQAFSEDPKITGSLPSWMETLQTSGLALPGEQEEEEELPRASYSEEEISTLFEQDDLPDWLGSDSAPDTGLTADSAGSLSRGSSLLGEQSDQPIERAELPGWLQAMRPVEAVTSVSDADLKQEEEVPAGDKERVGPLSGLSDVLPAEPHIIHFGTPPKAIPGFELSDVQKQHAELLQSLIGNEAASTPTNRRTVANPQQILRWVIAILLLTLTFAALWLGGSFQLALPLAEGMPGETLSVISLVNELTPEDKVLMAVEYQPGLSGEIEAASAALIQHMLLRDAQIVLVSSQPTGPGLGEAFLRENFSDDDYIRTHQYVNLGYVSGGAAGLLSFANDIRQTKADMAWDQAPLNQIQTIRDFALVVVLTDDPDTARSWVEQVHPLLYDTVYLTEVPLVMVVSAQAEPLVYPYYYTNPQQIAGLVSGIGGGAYYENVTGPSIAAKYWTAYNVGMMLAVIIIAIGSIYNLARNSLSGSSKGRA